MTATLVVIAKAPVAGRSKTRLCPPCTPAQAAALAEAALRDTLDAVSGCSAPRRVIALDGDPGPWLPSGYELIPQRGDGLGERLASATADAGGPLLIVGMDTPQLTAERLDTALETLNGADVVIGPAPDGGYWSIGLHDGNPAVFDGVPMSTTHTLAAQRTRVAALGLECVDLETLRDVDTFADAQVVAGAGGAPHFSAAVAQVARGLGTLV